MCIYVHILQSDRKVAVMRQVVCQLLNSSIEEEHKQIDNMKSPVCGGVSEFFLKSC